MTNGIIMQQLLQLLQHNSSPHHQEALQAMQETQIMQQLEQPVYFMAATLNLLHCVLQLVISNLQFWKGSDPCRAKMTSLLVKLTH